MASIKSQLYVEAEPSDKKISLNVGSEEPKLLSKRNKNIYTIALYTISLYIIAHCTIAYYIIASL